MRAVEILSQYGADVSLASCKWVCALLATADNADKEVVDIFLAHDAYVDLTGGATWNDAITAASSHFR